MMTDAQRRLVELDLRKAEIDKYYEDLEEALNAVKDEVGMDGFFQADDGTVYQVVQPEGHYVSYKKIGFIRTKREGERAGTLSVKKAQEAGFKVT